MELTATLLVGGAVVIMAIAAAAAIWQLVAGLPAGPLRKDWYVLLGFIACFIAGYLYYLVAPHAGVGVDEELVAPAMFFMGSAFVALVARTMLRTTRDLLRVSSLEVESMTDALTGLNNRRAFDRAWNVELARAKRFGIPLTLMVIDVDHFKAVNDTYGHATGDRVLIRLGQLIGSNLRATDVPARFGGEEFAVIAPHTTPRMTALVAERIRTAVERDAAGVLGEQQSPRKITVSIGVAGSDDLALQSEGIFERADAALYEAKRAGRNRVVIAPLENAASAEELATTVPLPAH